MQRIQLQSWTPVVIMALVVLFGILLFPSCASVVEQAQFRSGYVNVGQAELSADELDHADDLDVLELGLAYGGNERTSEGCPQGALADIALRGTTGADEEFDVDAIALRAGLKYYFCTGTKWVQPYVAGGYMLQHTRARDTETGFKEEDTDGGLYAAVGLESQVSRNVRFGVGWAMTQEVEFEGPDGASHDVDTDGLFATLAWTF